MMKVGPARMAESERGSRSFWEQMKSLADAETLSRHEDKVLLVLTLIIGAVVGLVVVAFILVTENLGARMYPAGGQAWRRLVIPAAGALLTGFLLKRYFPNARGSGIPQTKTALFINNGVIHFRTALGKFFCSSVSLASGIALGREGPSVQVGAGIASSLGRRLGLSEANVKALVPIGAAAALAAAFNTPIAAVLFTLEEVMGDLHARVLGSIVLSSATSWIVLHLVLGDEPLFHVPAYQLVHPLEFGLYAVLGLAGGLVSVAFVKMLLWQRSFFLRLPKNTQWVQPLAGGLLVGVLGWFVPEVLGVGYGYVSKALNGEMLLSMMALLVLLKLIATTACYASGNAGGIFGPSLFVGAMLGGAFGGGAHMLFPDYTGGVGAYALVGMGTAFAGIVRVPLTSVIMIFEVTRDYSIIVPLMISNLISYFVSSQLQEEPIYEALQHQDGIHLPPGAGERENPLVVREGVREPSLILDGAETAEKAASKIAREQEAWPVVSSGAYVGMLTMARLEQALKEGRAQHRLADLLQSEEFPHVHADDPLDVALRRMAESGVNLLPVVSRVNLRQLMGVISLRDVMAVYGFEGKQARRAEPVPAVTRTPKAALGGIIAALILAVLLTTFLSYLYRTQRITRTQQFMKAGNELMQGGRYEEAVEQFRHALSISHSSEERLALSTALAKAGHLNEAEQFLRELLREKPDAGPPNLGLGRVYFEEGDTDHAIVSYHRAIDGAWPKDAQANRIQARLELINALGKLGAKQRAQAELLALVTEKMPDAAIRNRTGHLLLEFGLPEKSAAVFRSVVQQNNRDAGAYQGLGEAELAMGDFLAAAPPFRQAAQLDPGNQTYQQRLQMVQQAIALDPNIRGLHAADRFQRSERLLQASLAALDSCVAGSAAELPEAVRNADETARKVLQHRSPPHSYSDAADSNVALAQQIWGERIRRCGGASSEQEPLSRVMARLSR
jgi:chloride channel protein, CIC family